LATLVEFESDLVSSDDEEEARLHAHRENLLDDDESLGSEDLWDDDQDSTPDDPKSFDDAKSSNGDDQSSSLDDSKSSDDAESSIGNDGKEDEEDSNSTEVEDPPGIQSRRSTRIRVWMMALSVALSVTPPLCHYNRTVRYCTMNIASIVV
jgi:hypothetical protein